MHPAQATHSRPVPAIVQRMAEKMRWHFAGSGSCSIEDLKADGFNGFEIQAYSDQAAHHARHGFVRRVERADQDANWQLEPKPGQHEPPVITSSDGSIAFFVKAMLSIARGRDIVPQSRTSLRQVLIGAGFEEAAIDRCIDEVHAALHPAKAGAAPAPVNAYALPLIGGAQ